MTMTKREFLYYIMVATIMTIVGASAIVISVKAPSIDTIKVHNMDDDVVCYTFNSGISCLQVAK